MGRDVVAIDELDHVIDDAADRLAGAVARNHRLDPHDRGFDGVEVELLLVDPGGELRVVVGEQGVDPDRLGDLS